LLQVFDQKRWEQHRSIKRYAWHMSGEQLCSAHDLAVLVSSWELPGSAAL
jgi:hypothetical protein